MGKNTAQDVRQKLLDIAPAIIDTSDKLARGELGDDFKGNPQMLQALLRLVSPLMSLEDDAVQVDTQPEWTTEERISTITDSMLNGSISLAQAKALIDVLGRASDQIDAQEIKLALQKLADAA